MPSSGEMIQTLKAAIDGANYNKDYRKRLKRTIY